MADASVTQPTSTSDEPAVPPRLWLDWLVVLVLGLIVYGVTCAPDVLMGDSGVFHLRVAQFPPTPAKYMTDALVQVHAVYLGVAKLFTLLPGRTVPYWVNMASAWFGAVTLANAFVLIRLLTGCRRAAVIGTLSIGLGHTFWAFSVIAECLTLVTACITAELLALTIFARTGGKRWFLLAALINGVSISNHLMGALGMPVYAVLAVVWWRRGRLRGVDLWATIGLWLVGTSVYLFLILRAMVETGQFLRIVRSATTGGWEAANVRIGASLLVKVAAYLGLQYPTLLLGLAWVALRVKPLRDADGPIKWTVVAAAAIQFVFAARYPRPDQYSFFVPFYAIAGVLIGIGTWAVVRRWRWTWWVGLVLAIAPIGVYVVLPGMARRMQLNLFGREIPYRDPYEFFLKPWRQGDKGVRRFCEETFEQLPPSAVLFADPTPAGALFYLQEVEGKRKDVKIVFRWDNVPLNSLLIAEPPGFVPRWVRPVYTVDTRPRYAPLPFIRDCTFRKEGVLYRVLPPENMPTTAWK